MTPWTEMECLIVMGSAWGEWPSRQHFPGMCFRGNYGSVIGSHVFENNYLAILKSCWIHGLHFEHKAEASYFTFVLKRSSKWRSGQDDWEAVANGSHFSYLSVAMTKAT